MSLKNGIKKEGLLGEEEDEVNGMIEEEMLRLR
jgi:hypothetical protein